MPWSERLLRSDEAAVLSAGVFHGYRKDAPKSLRIRSASPITRRIVLTERGIRPAGQVFNNRNLEKLFGKFESVKFFLTRESLREVIVRR